MKDCLSKLGSLKEKKQEQQQQKTQIMQVHTFTLQFSLSQTCIFFPL